MISTSTKVSEPPTDDALTRSTKPILPSKKPKANLTHCSDIPQYPLELFMEGDVWIDVWPLLTVWDKKKDQTQSKNKSQTTDTRQCKKMYLFKTKKDRDDENLIEAMNITIYISDIYNVYEHYPFGIEKFRYSEYYFILNGSKYPKYLFKCINELQSRLGQSGQCTIFHQIVHFFVLYSTKSTS